MFDIALHFGTEHPELLYIGTAGLLFFGAGAGLGLYARPILEDTESDSVTELNEQ